MSTYWGYRCQTCEESSGRPYNRNTEPLIDAWVLRNQIKTIAENSIWLEVGLMGDYESLVSWVCSHIAHDVCLENEYGETEEIPLRK